MVVIQFYSCRAMEQNHKRSDTVNNDESYSYTLHAVMSPGFHSEDKIQ